MKEDIEAIVDEQERQADEEYELRMGYCLVTL